MRLLSRLLSRLVNAGVTHSDLFEIGPHGPRRRRYDGDQLRKIRAEKGVGRPPRRRAPETVAEWAWVFQARCTNAMAMGARVFGGMRLQYEWAPNGLRHPVRHAR